MHEYELQVQVDGSALMDKSELSSHKELVVNLKRFIKYKSDFMLSHGIPFKK